MNYNVYAYLIYLPVIFWITFRVGWLFYTHGEIYILGLFQGNKQLTKAVNNTLLAGYYLVNLGYATFTLSFWQPIETVQEIISTVASNVGLITLALALMHYFNLAAIAWLGKSQFLVRKTPTNGADGLTSKTRNHGKLLHS
ncbi:MAG: hypothetical protein JKY18_03745 [Flavobacteriales bacterium]|nr:hypothetical protein [Flavobacteriales bacterium]